MMSQRKVDTATEADWSFVGDDEIEEAIDGAAHRLAVKWTGHIDKDDAIQDAYLWLAVRPERVARIENGGSHIRLHQDIYTNLNSGYDARFGRVQHLPHHEVFIAED